MSGSSLVADRDGQVVGHILFSDLPVVTEAGTVPALRRLSLAVLPEVHNQGIGSVLLRRGLQVCKGQGHRLVVVVGHPHFYQRFGFSSKLAANLASPFSERESFMALELVPGRWMAWQVGCSTRRRSGRGREAGEAGKSWFSDD